jgi:PAS domain S-box-containing protein
LEVNALALELRKTGISVVGDVPWGTHYCHFYETKQDLLDTLVPYFKAGLESKEFCLWVVSDSELITVEEAKGALEQAVPDLDRHLANESIEILNGLDWYLKENGFSLERVTSAWDAKLKRAMALGYDGMRVSGDTFWLGTKDWKDFCAYEEQLNDSITNRPMTLLCTYPLAKSGAAEILDVVQTHQFATARRQGEWKIIESQELIQANAEIRRLNKELQRVPERTPTPPLILRYGVAVLSVIAALIIVRWMEIVLGSASHASIFLCAVIFSAWFGGVKPGLLAVALSMLAFDYYFVSPNHSLAIEIKEIPRLVIFSLSALFVGLLSASQRRAAESLRQARDVLNGTVQQLKQTNESLHAKIGERNHAEALLHAKEQEFRAIVENAPDQIIRYDREFRRSYVNPAVVKAYGLPAEALTGKPIGSVVQDAGLEVKDDEVAQVRQRIASVFDTGKSHEYEMTWPMPAERKYYSVRLFPELDLNGSVVNVLAISRDITKRRQAEEKLKATSDQLRALSASVQSAREEEATRIAREIHDELGSALTSLKLDLESIRREESPATSDADPSRLREQIKSMMQLVDQTVDTVRRISSELRPSVLDDIGLVAAMRWQARQFEAQAGIVCQCDFGLEEVDLDQQQSTAIFRVFQEALTNVLRHAEATRIDITLEKEDDDLVLTISDNGRGITAAEKSEPLSLGLLGMRERVNLIGGTIDIAGVEGKGTEIMVRVSMVRKS